MRIMLVAPGEPMGTPAVMTTPSPAPSLRGFPRRQRLAFGTLPRWLCYIFRGRSSRIGGSFGGGSRISTSANGVVAIRKAIDEVGGDCDLQFRVTHCSPPRWRNLLADAASNSKYSS